MTMKHSCPAYYQEELKTEIIAKSAAINKNNGNFFAQRAELIYGGFFVAILAAWSGIIYPPLFYVALVGGYAWLTWEWCKVSQAKKDFMQQDHGETHRLAEIFLQERQGRKEYCLGKLKAKYSNNPGLLVNS